MMESFWATLKKECAEKTIFSSWNEAKKGIFEYIEAYYHRKRRHSSLGYMSPVDYEKQEKKTDGHHS
jgi:putative transposase